jgi:hypothetical protein
MILLTSCTASAPCCAIQPIGGAGKPEIRNHGGEDGRVSAAVNTAPDREYVSKLGK